MSQDAIQVTSGTGLDVRTNINKALLTLATSYAGPAQPNPIYPYMWWLDTVNNLVKQAKADTSGFITKGKLMPDGTIQWYVTAIENLSSIVTGFQSDMDSLNSRVGANPSFRNKVINGDFSVWQRGTTQTGVGYGADDRWFNSHIGSTKVISLQSFTPGQTDVPGSPKNFSRTTVTSIAGAGNCVNKQHHIDSVYTLAGNTVTLSFWAKADSAKNMAVSFLQYFGTGGSPTTEFHGAKFTLGSAWQKFTITVTMPSIAGKTIGANSYVGFAFWFDAGSNFNFQSGTLGQQSGTFDIARVQLEEGSIATPFEEVDRALTLIECKKYCNVGNAQFIGSGYTTYAQVGAFIAFDVSMRVTPTLTFGTPWESFNISAIGGISPLITGFRIYGTVAAAGNANYSIGYIADAEL